MRFLFRLYRDAYQGLPPQAYLLAAATLVNRLGSMVLPFLTLYLTNQRGFSLGEVGALMGFCGAAGVAGSYLGGKVCDLVDAKQVQIWTLGMSGILLTALGWVHSKPLLFAGFGLFYLLNEAFRPASAVAIQAAVPPAARRQAAGLRRLAINLGVSFAPVIGGLLAVYDYFWLFVVDGGTALAAALFLVFYGSSARSTAAAASAESSTLSPWRDKYFLAGQALMLGCAILFMQLMSAVPLTLNREYGLREDTIGLLLAINPVVIVAVEMLLVRALTRRPALPIMGLGTFLIGGGLGCLGWGNVWPFAALGFLILTLGEMLTFSTVEAWVVDRAGAANRGAYLGAYSMTFGIATAVAPLIGLSIYHRWGSQTLWTGSAIAGLILGAGFCCLHQLEKASLQARSLP